MDQMAEEIVAHEAALNKSLDITKEKNAEIRIRIASAVKSKPSEVSFKSA